MYHEICVYIQLITLWSSEMFLPLPQTPPLQKKTMVEGVSERLHVLGCPLGLNHNSLLGLFSDFK